MEQREVVIVGGGAAGLAAGQVVARAQTDVLLIDQGQPRNGAARHVRGYLSRDGVSPRTLSALGREEFTRYGGEVRSGAVVSAERTPSGLHRLTLAGDHVVLARALLVATGVTDELPAIAGARRLWGSSLFHCPHCHGHEVRGQRLGVIAGADKERSLHQAALLRRFSPDVTFFADRAVLSTRERARLLAIGVDTVLGALGDLRQDDHAATVVTLNDGRRFARDALFVTPTTHANAALLTALGCAVDEPTGHVLVDGRGRTSVNGVWAAGNVVDPGAQLITAAGSAAAAAVALVSWLVKQDEAVAYGTTQMRGEAS